MALNYDEYGGIEAMAIFGLKQKLKDKLDSAKSQKESLKAEAIRLLNEPFNGYMFLKNAEKLNQTQESINQILNQIEELKCQH